MFLLHLWTIWRWTYHKTWILHSNILNVIVQYICYYICSLDFRFSSRVRWWSLMRSPLNRWYQEADATSLPLSFVHLIFGLSLKMPAPFFFPVIAFTSALDPQTWHSLPWPRHPGQGWSAGQRSGAIFHQRSGVRPAIWRACPFTLYFFAVSCGGACKRK